MNVTFGLINGMNIGIEFIAKDPDEDILESAIIIDLIIFRIAIWLNDEDE